MEKKKYLSPICLASTTMRTTCVICGSGDDNTLPPGAGPSGGTGTWEAPARNTLIKKA